MKNLKKIVRIISTVGIMASLLLFGFSFFCKTNLCLDKIEFILPILFVFFPTFIFSLITYRMREEVFQSWFRFAVWWVPVMVYVTYFMLLHKDEGGGYVGDMGATAFIFSLLYAIFIIVSLVKIIRARSATRGKNVE